MAIFKGMRVQQFTRVLVLGLILFPSASLMAAMDYGSLPVTLKVESTSSSSQSTVPITFGQVFSPGHIVAGQQIKATVDGAVVPIQVDKKATHADGSLRHAVITVELPNIANNETKTILLNDGAGGNASGSINSAALLAATFNGKPFDAVITINLAGASYRASARDILSNTSSPKMWLQGPLASEWILSSPLKASDGTPHPHLTARFNVRAYKGLQRVKVDVILENNWSFVPNPTTLVYDLSVSIAGDVKLQRSALTHWHHARWVETFWAGAEPAVHLRHDIPYLLATRALPNYDTNIVPTDTADVWNANPAAVDLMTIPPFTSDKMGNTGSQPGIGPLPEWAAEYLLSMDANTKRTTVGMSQRAGTWSIHYRDEATDRPISILGPQNGSITIRGSNAEGQTRSGDKKLENCTLDCTRAGSWDVAHLPDFSYLPYLVTGDFYHLEELEFWADFALLYQAPGKNYREYEKGLLASDQIRGQAWGLRTIANAAYISPDDDPLKAVFENVLHENYLYYQQSYLVANAPYANNLGVTRSHSTNTSTQTWMDDFLTFTVGYIYTMGYSEWNDFLLFKAKFPIGRMIDDGFCWAFAAPYLMGIGPADNEFFPSFAGITQSDGSAIPGNYPFDANCPVPGTVAIQGTRFDDATGYAADMQPGMAYAVDTGIARSAEAWERFRLGTSGHLYAEAPEFAVVPRSIDGNAFFVRVWASPATIERGSSSTIYWDSSAGASCWGSGDWQPSNLANTGNQSVTPSNTSSYTVSCQIGSGPVEFRSVQVVVTAPVTNGGSGTGSGTGTGSSSGSGTGSSSGSGNNNGNPGDNSATSKDLGEEAGGAVTPWLLFVLTLVAAGRRLHRH